MYRALRETETPADEAVNDTHCKMDRRHKAARRRRFNFHDKLHTVSKVIVRV
jgi:hypothetical protein